MTSCVLGVELLPLNNQHTATEPPVQDRWTAFGFEKSSDYDTHTHGWDTPWIGPTSSNVMNLNMTLAVMFALQATLLISPDSNVRRPRKHTRKRKSKLFQTKHNTAT